MSILGNGKEQLPQKYSYPHGLSRKKQEKTAFANRINSSTPN
jgi:hypothetical protein